jgi:hypothetical protein
MQVLIAQDWNKALIEQISILEKNPKTMSNSVNALTGRINEIEK